MTASSSGSIRETHIGLTFGTLAGGERLNGLPMYEKTLSKRIDAVKVKLDNEDSTCKSSTVVLGLLAALAAAGCGTLIAYSGIPATMDLTLFVPGVILGGMSLSLTIWLIVVIVRTINFRQKQQQEVDALSDPNSVEFKVSNETALNEMHREGVTSDHIACAMQQFSADQRKDFVTWTYSQYFSDEGDMPLTEQNKTVLKAFAQFPSALQGLKQDRLDCQFAIEILTHLDSKVFTAQNQDVKGKDLVLKLMQQVGAPKKGKADALRAYAQHPLALAELGQSDAATYDKHVILAVYRQMSDEQKIVFLGQWADDYAALKAQHEALRANEMQDSTDAQKEILSKRKEMRLKALNCLNHSLSPDFANQFALNAEAPSEEKAKKMKTSQVLLAQIARWPSIAAQEIYLSDALMGHHDMIMALYNAMTPEGRAEFIKAAAAAINRNDTVDHAKWISAYAKAKACLPDPTLRIFANTPAAMAKTLKKLSEFEAAATTDEAKELAKRAIMSANAILDLMSPENKAAFLHCEKVINATVFKTRMNEMLKAPIAEDIPVVGYFTYYPEDFNELVLKNEALGDENARGVIALNLLEAMNGKGEKVIPVLDKGVLAGTPYFNYLTNMLIDQVKGRDLATAPVSEKRAQLIARFAYAEQMAEAADKWVLGTAIWKLKPKATEEDKKVWENFDKIALTQKTNVWKPKPAELR